MGKYNHKNDIILSGKHIYKDKKINMFIMTHIQN